MSIQILGIEAEKKARLFLKKKGFILQQIDWIGKLNNRYYIFEVKEKELFKPPPFLGTGADISQINLRMKLLQDLGLRTILLVFEKNTDNLYYQYLDILESKKYFDTKNNIRIYDINNFIKCKINLEFKN